MLRRAGRNGRKYGLTPKGRTQLRRASWEFLAFGSPLLEDLRRWALERLAGAVRDRGWHRVVLYGAAAAGRAVLEWAREAGLTTVAVCDEERDDKGLTPLSQLSGLDYDCIVLADWARAEDPLLMRLLEQYGPVVGLFLVDGAAKPEWR